MVGLERVDIAGVSAINPIRISIMNVGSLNTWDVDVVRNIILNVGSLNTWDVWETNDAIQPQISLMISTSMMKFSVCSTFSSSTLHEILDISFYHPDPAVPFAIAGLAGHGHST